MSKPKPPKSVVLAFAFKQLYALKAIAKFTFERFRRLQGCYKFARDHLYSLRAVTSFVFMTVVFTGVYISTATPLTAQAATNNTINFQARLESASGAIVTDGNYNVEFKLYSVSSAGTAEWTEDYTYNSGPGATDARIHVANGYLTVNLGSITSFPTTINWDQQQWLTMNIGGTSGTSVTWDGEMNPRLQLTAVPYALRAGMLASSANASGYQSTLSLTQPGSGVTTGNEVFTLPDMGAAGTYTLLTSGNGVQLQSTTPGTQQSGNFNISGAGLLNTLDATGTTLAIGSTNTYTGAVNIDTSSSVTTGTVTIGGSNQTGQIIIGQSTATNTISIGSAIPAAGNTQTINIGLNNAAGGTTNVNIGSGSSASAGSTSITGKSAVMITGYGPSIWATSGASLNVTGGTTLTLKSTTSSAITLDSGTTGAVNIGTGGNSKTITIGATNSAITDTIKIGANTNASATSTLTIGSTIGSSTTTIQGGNGLSALDLESNGGFVTIAGNSTSQFVDIGSTGSGSNTINIGNTSATVTIESGSSNNWLENNSPILGTVVQSVTNNSINAFQVQNATSGVILNTDTTTNTVTVTGDVQASAVGAPGSAPTVAVNATAGNLNSTYYYTITFVTPTGETEYGPVSTGVTPVNQQVNLSSIPTGLSGVVTKRAIYRTKAGGSNTGPFYRVAYVNDNSTTTYTDNVADASLSSSTAPQANTTAYFSNPDDQTQSEVFGAGAIASNIQAVAVGNGAEAHYHGVAIGYNASNSYSSGGVAVGAASSTNWDSVAVGDTAVANQHSVAIGEASSANNNYSIAIGQAATTNASNQLVIGSSTTVGAYVQNAYIGSGITDTTPQSVTLNATGGSGTNIAGASLSLAGGAGTGSANGGNINFEIAAPGTSGSSANSLSTVVQISGANGSAQFKNAVNSTTSFQVQNALGNSVLTVDTSSNGTQGQVILGKASTNNGALVFDNSSNGNTITISSGFTSASYSLTLPTTGPSTSQCLQSDATTASQLVFGSCSGSGATTLQQAYNNSAGASPSIDVTSTNLGVTIQNDSGSPIAGTLFGVRDKANAGTLFSIANTAVTTIRTGNSTNNYDTAGAFQVQNHSGNNIFSIDTSGNQAVLGKASSIGGTLDFKTVGAGDITLNTASTATAYTLTLPTAGPSTSQCLLSGASTASQLTFGSCGSAPTTTLQQAYNNSNTAAPTITLNNASNPALIIQNTNSSPISGTLFGVNANAASGLGSSLFSVASTGDTNITSSDTTGTVLGVAANSITSGAGLSLAANALTTGYGISLSTTSTAQTSGSLLSASDTAALTSNGASITGNLLNASRSITANITGNSVTAPALDTFTKKVTTGSTAQVQSFTITVNNHTNRFLAVWVGTNYVPPINVTYDSLQMTNVDQIPGNSGNFAWSLWVLVNPPTGTTFSVSVTQNANDAGAMNAIATSWYNVSQSNPWQYQSSTTGTSGQPSITAPSVSGQLIVDSFFNYTGSPCVTTDGSTVGTGQTKVTSYIEGTYTCTNGGVSYKSASGSTTSMSWTGTGANSSYSWAEGTIALNGVPASTASVTGAAASISSNCTSTTANACTDSGNVLSVTQSDITATGSAVEIQNASSAPALQIMSTSGTAVAMNVYTSGLQTTPILGDGVLNLGEINGISMTSTGTLNTGGADYAEYFYQGNPGSLSPGDVVCLDAHGRAVACDSAANTSLTGVVSTKASVVGNAAIHHATNPDATALVGMLGQLQVKVSTANGPIEPGDMLTMSSTPGVAVKATAPGMTIGTAMQPYTGTSSGEITAYVHIGYFDPTASNGSYIQDGGALSVMNLNVDGNTTLTNLTVTGSATFATLTVQALTVGHIVSNGTTPIIAAGTTAGTSARATVTGTDTSGEIIIDTGTGTATGDLSDLTFAQDFESAPTVVLTAGDANAAKLQLYVSPVDTGFSINAATTNGLLDNQTYTFYYHVIQ